MKKMLGFVVMVMCIGQASAQMFDEWFRQRKTQIKYLKEQILALKAYGDVVNKGYAIAKEGLSVIASSRDVDYRQHDGYFQSLLTVKPAILRYPKVETIFKMHRSIESGDDLMKLSSNAFLNQKERQYILSVLSNLLEGSSGLLNELTMILSDGQLSLKDDERLARIEGLYIQMQDRYQFMQSFTNGVKVLVVSQFKEKIEVEKFLRLYEIK